MSSNWAPPDRIVGKKAFERARSASEADIMKRFRSYPVKSVSDLWKLEQDLQHWRRGTQGMYLKYESLEENIAEWIENKWLTLSDISAFSESRLDRIKSRLKKK